MDRLSDFELNKAIAELLGQFAPCPFDIEMNVVIDGVLRCHDDSRILTHPDYCNNWNDLMPLVVEHGISLEIYNLGRCSAYRLDSSGEREFDYMKKLTPQRALAECLLKVLQEK